jgi:hypothetical protein
MEQQTNDTTATHLINKDAFITQVFCDFVSNLGIHFLKNKQNCNIQRLIPCGSGAFFGDWAEGGEI